MKPTQEIQQDAAPATPEPTNDRPIRPAAGAGEKLTPSKSAPDGVPADLTHLAVAAGLLLTAFLIFWMGLYLPNHAAVRVLVASFGTFALVWVLHRLRVFQRPHGGVIGCGAVALFAAALPFIERGFLKLDSAAKSGLAGEQQEKAEAAPVATMPPPPVPTRQQPSSVPPPPTPENVAEEKPEVDETVHDLIPAPVNPAAGKIMRVIQDVTLTIGGKKYLIKAGSEFHFSKVEDGKVVFRAGKQDATIDFENVSITGKSKETPKQISQLAQAELMKRYPAIGVKDSKENAVFLLRIQELRITQPKSFEDPQWPLTLGEQIAEEEGWKNTNAATDENTPPDALPADAMKKLQPADEVPLEPRDPINGSGSSRRTPSDVPQEAPPVPEAK